MKSNAKTPTEYINSLEEPRKTEIKKLHSLICKTVPNLKPHMKYGMLGYGTYHYKYASGRQGDWMIIGLANQKNYISLYACLSDGKQYVAEKYRKDLPKSIDYFILKESLLPQKIQLIPWIIGHKTRR